MFEKIVIFLFGILVLLWGGIFLFVCVIEKPLSRWEANRRYSVQNREYDKIIFEIIQKIFGEVLDEKEVRCVAEAMQAYADSEINSVDIKRFSHNELMICALIANDTKEIAREVAKCQFRVGEKLWADFLMFRKIFAQSNRKIG